MFFFLFVLSFILIFDGMSICQITRQTHYQVSCRFLSCCFFFLFSCWYHQSVRPFTFRDPSHIINWTLTRTPCGGAHQRHGERIWQRSFGQKRENKKTAMNRTSSTVYCGAVEMIWKIGGSRKQQQQQHWLRVDDAETHASTQNVADSSELIAFGWGWILF